ncbi:HNH endonuclease [Bacteroides phage PhiCrAssBcn23]|nr:HNH endonuclease [Bacteroides phage PhiCrAssBcn22]WCS67340.1 HNH endonuclease [Bacteroides phage PhiCrAssBcn23]
MENWKVIVEYPSYSISSLGRVRNNNTNRILKAVSNTSGYLQVRLYKEGQYKSFIVHQLVATHFLPVPSGDLELNHIDEDKLNNRWDNLEWIPHKDNCNHGTRNIRMANKLSKPVIQYTLDGIKVREFNSATEVERLFGYKQSLISSCCLNNKKTAYGFRWQFK